ncbi:uncharacterized protein LOC114124500 isoform X2 [Aphis gossypii]|uniref:uncharacterized protein LOC114124500 isoform X2 n=1 Tax=Aphis gossypii TaxID=80765 RepID=UPI0021590E4D|nr:uncharacterized protein LOC114124500 isoform X2 [Aphis gossypii]
MYFPQPLLLICILLILTERVHSQSCKGPGISSCSYSCFRKSYCGFEEIAVSDIPVECTSLNYVGAFVDEYYGVGPGNSGTDYTLLDTLLRSNKDVFLYYGRELVEIWAEMFANGCAEANSLKEMKGLHTFLDQHKGIDGLILTGLQYTCYTKKEVPQFTDNFKIYLGVLKKSYPDMIIGMDLYASHIINQHTNAKFKNWLDISIIDKDIDFYAISLEYFNSCTADLINTGTTPMSGTSAYNTLDKLKDALKSSGIPKEKIYFKFITNPQSPYNNLTICQVNNEMMCAQPVNAKDWCSDTILSFNEKGKYAKDNGAGFIARYIDFEDKINNTCECENTYYAFNALLDGFNCVTSSSCNLFDNIVVIP